MIGRFFLVLFCMASYMPLLWPVLKLKVMDHMTKVFFAALEKADYGLLSSYTENFNGSIVLKDTDGNTPLHYAIATNNRELVQWLLQHEQYTYDSKEQNNVGQTPFDLALQVPDKNIAMLMIEHRCNYTMPLELKTALQTYVMQPSRLSKNQVLTLINYNYTQLAKISLRYIGNCNELVLGTTLLHAALAKRDSELIKALLDAGASLEQVDAQSITVLQKAQEYADQAFAAYTQALEYRSLEAAALEAPVLYYYEALISSFEGYQRDKLSLLFWINKRLSNSYEDAESQDIYYLQMLTDTVAITMPDNHGLTLLHKAVTARKLGLMRVLLIYGADLFMADFKGQTPFMLAVLQADEPLKLIIKLAYALRDQEQEQHYQN